MVTTTPAALDWQHMDFSWLNPDGEGFGAGGSPYQLYMTGTMDFSWLPQDLLPKIPSPWDNLPGGGGDGGGISGSVTWREDFNDPAHPLFSRMWGGVIDTGTPGQLTLHASDATGFGDIGAMIPPTGATAGNGYGLFSARVAMDTDPGPYLLLWPGTDVWPGPELDMVEILPGGRPYSTIHWDANPGVDGNSDNSFRSHVMDGIDVTQFHTYQMEWAPGRLSFFVDGKHVWDDTDNVPADAAHGGENLAMGIGIQNWWNMGDQHGDNWITIDWASYMKPGDYSLIG